MKADYIVINNEEGLQALEALQASGRAMAAPERVYVIQDQVIPANSPEVAMQQQRLAQLAELYGTQYMYGKSMAGNFLAQEVAEAGNIVVGADQALLMVGAKGALGLQLAAAELTEALAGAEVAGKLTSELVVRVTGELAVGLDMRDAGMTLAALLKDRVNGETLVRFEDRTAGLSMDERMLLCGWCQTLGVGGAVFDQGQCWLNVPGTALETKAVELNLSEVIPMYYNEEGPLTKIEKQAVKSVFIGGSQGGLLADIKLAAELVAGKQVASGVRFNVAPASSEIYYMAATAGYLTTIMQAGGLVLNQCALPPVQVLVGEGELLVSNDIHAEKDYAGKGGKILLTDTRQAVEGALRGYIGAEKARNTTTLDQAPASFTGRVWKFSDDIDTDIIIPTQHISYPTMDEVQTHIFEPLRPELAALIKPGDILVAGNNFGCGSSREQAAEVLAHAGIKAVVAKSFARIFFRNAINNGLLLIECPELPDKVSEGDELTVHINRCIVHKGVEYAIPYLAENLYKLIVAGGLVKSVKKQNGVG